MPVISAPLANRRLISWRYAEADHRCHRGRPHRSMPKRGPKCKLGYSCVFNLILWVLYTGMQWKCLPVPQDTHGKPSIHYTTVYKVFAR